MLNLINAHCPILRSWYSRSNSVPASWNWARWSTGRVDDSREVGPRFDSEAKSFTKSEMDVVAVRSYVIINACLTLNRLLKVWWSDVKQVFLKSILLLKKIRGSLDNNWGFKCLFVILFKQFTNEWNIFLQKSMKMFW